MIPLVHASIRSIIRSIGVLRPSGLGSTSGEIQNYQNYYFSLSGFTKVESLVTIDTTQSNGITINYTVLLDVTTTRVTLSLFTSFLKHLSIEIFEQYMNNFSTSVICSCRISFIVMVTSITLVFVSKSFAINTLTFRNQIKSSSRLYLTTCIQERKSYYSNRCNIKVMSLKAKKLSTLSNSDSSLIYMQQILRLPVSHLKGIGNKMEILFNEFGILSIQDLLFQFPKSVVNWNNFDTIASETEDPSIYRLLVVKVSTGFGKIPSTVICEDENGSKVRLVYVNYSPIGNYNFISSKSKFIVNKYIYVRAKLRRAGRDFFETSSPNLIHDDESIKSSSMECRYRVPNGISQSKYKTYILEALKLLKHPNPSESDDWIDNDMRKQMNWMKWDECIERLHNPISEEDLYENSKFFERLAFDELLAKSIVNLVTKDAAASTPLMPDSFAVTCDGSGISQTLLDSLPFQLTPSQKQAINDIRDRLNNPKRMSHLLQGDVGSGKSIVSYYAILYTVESKKFSILLAPTEILANQHFENLKKYSDHLEIRFISSTIKGKIRENLLLDVSSGKVDVLIGTHSLLQESVRDSFPLDKLGLVVIDEEQRFGVSQRDLLSNNTNVLTTTATPIPRSLVILLQDDYSISTLHDKPMTKRPIVTTIYGSSKIQGVIDRIGANLPYGTKVFWVTPFLEPSEMYPGSAAIERFEQFQKLFPGKVGMIHGKMSSVDKITIMNQFMQSNSEIQLLVCTSVIEVGMDIPDVSICIIDCAERFGLSSLHQIRGRIGRGAPPKNEKLNGQCHCVLLYNDKNDLDDMNLDVIEESDSFTRLNTLKQSEDGFEIAEADLKLRGPGDIFGMKQSGKQDYRVAKLSIHSSLLQDSYRLAKDICSRHQNDMNKLHIKVLLDLYTNSTNRGEVDSSQFPVVESNHLTIAKTVKKEIPLLKPITQIKDSRLSSSLLSSSLHDSLMVILDLETTGLSIYEDKIIQLGAIVYQETTVLDEGNIFNAYIRPHGKKISEKISQITGITQDFVRENGISLEEAWRNFDLWIQYHLNKRNHSNKSSIIFIAHNGKNYDFPLLDREVIRLRNQKLLLDKMSTNYGLYSWSKEKSYDLYLLDSLEMFKDNVLWEIINKQHGLLKPAKLNLGFLHEYIVGKKLEGAHNAISDIQGIQTIFNSQIMSNIWKDIGNKKLYSIDNHSITYDAKFLR